MLMNIEVIFHFQRSQVNSLRPNLDEITEVSEKAKGNRTLKISALFFVAIWIPVSTAVTTSPVMTTLTTAISTCFLVSLLSFTSFCK
jgi:hypothetical protein